MIVGEYAYIVIRFETWHDSEPLEQKASFTLKGMNAKSLLYKQRLDERANARNCTHRHTHYHHHAHSL